MLSDNVIDWVKNEKYSVVYFKNEKKFHVFVGDNLVKGGFNVASDAIEWAESEL